MERKIIAWLKSRFPARKPLLVGIGDDAAVIQVPTNRIVITTDAIVDGVHFELPKHSWRRIGHKAIAVNLSDLAAMGAKPLAVVITLLLPRGVTMEQVQELYAGIEAICQRWQVVIAGGDTNIAQGPLAISTTAVGSLGESQRPWLCSGASPGDEILVSGSFGGSILGKHLDFEPRCDLQRDMRDRYQVSSVTDVSDGLLFNLNAILRASGCGAHIDLALIPIAAAAYELASQNLCRMTALDHALYDGEDFELVIVAGREQAAAMMADPSLGQRLTKIGTIVSGSGVHAVDPDGNLRPLEIRGYSHGE